MGHKFADADSFGAAVGICRAAEALEKKAYIVIDEISASLKPLYLSYAENPEYGEKMFLKPQEVLKMADEKMCIRDRYNSLPREKQNKNVDSAN